MLNKQNRPLIQLFAMVLMVIDHIGLVFFPDVLFLRMIGRLCFPLYVYLVAMGFHYTQSIFIYALRLLILAGVSQWAFASFGIGKLNVLFLLGLGVLYLWCLQNRRYLGACLIVAMAAVFPIEYGLYGLALLVVFAYAEKPFWLVWLSLIVSAFSVIAHGPLQFFAFFAVFLIVYLPECDLRINRYVWRYFYPAHLYFLKGVLCVFA